MILILKAESVNKNMASAYLLNTKPGTTLRMNVFID